MNISECRNKIREHFTEKRKYVIVSRQRNGRRRRNPVNVT